MFLEGSIPLQVVVADALPDEPLGECLMCNSFVTLGVNLVLSFYQS